MKSGAYVLCIFAAVLIAVPAIAQTYLDSIRPQPRQAYVRVYMSATFDPGPQNSIFLNPGNPSLAAAAELNRGLREKGKDTLEVRLWSAADSLEPGIILDFMPEFINRFLSRIPGQSCELSRTYPGPEGYILEVLPGRVILGGSDETGLHYGVGTFLQLLWPTPGWWGLQSCRIVDAPEFPIRWFYHSTNIQVADNVSSAKAIWKEASRWRLNGVHLNDSKFSRPTTLPDFYFENVETLIRFASDRYLKIIPGVMPIGYSNSLLFHDPNLASGLPVRRQRCIIEADTARELPLLDVSLPNGGFETGSGNTFPGFRFIDEPGKISFADNTVRHTGNTSIRFENFKQYSPEHGHGRVSYWTPVTSFTEYHVSGWVRTEGLQPANSLQISVLSNAGYNLAFNDFSVASTTGGWKKLEFTFNSLEADTAGIYWGVWGARDGRVWWDDLLLEETRFVNLIRRPGAPLVVTASDPGEQFSEGIDFDTLTDPLSGTVPYGGSYTKFHTPPAFRIRSGGRIRNGDTLYISYHHAIVIHSDQVMVTMSDPRVYDILDREFAVLDSVFDADTYFMQHDEIRTMNWDEGDLARGKSPGELLADNVQRCTDIIKRHHPGADVWVWTDMFDEFHNARQSNYYLVNGDLRGSADRIPSSIGMVNWNGRNGIVQNSLNFFSGKGFRQISAPYYDTDEQHIRIWKEWTRGTDDFKGMMYTTWQRKYDHLEAFGEYAWNHAPYIYHTPPLALHPGQSIQMEMTVRGDRFDNGWTAGQVSLFYRFAPGDPFDSLVSNPDSTGRVRIDIAVSSGSRWLQWYITAEDNRGWTSRIPFADSLYYELGTLVTAIEHTWQPGSFRLFGFSPNPTYNSGPVFLEWFAADTDRVLYTIYDVYGRKVLVKDVVPVHGGLQRTSVELASIDSGLYFCTLSDGQSISEPVKLIVIR